ncbi:MAG TPA: hypothetical protein VKX17_04755 [Planctomycetota bacterium]|nr:hypothetical protein [Planctomycetota bacterium]
MTIKSQIEYACPACALAWLPYAPGLSCPKCGRAVPETEVTAIVPETLESAKFNKRLYGKFELEFWLTRRLGDRYFQWAFKALDVAEKISELSAEKAALAAIMELDLEEMTPYREHILGYLTAVVEAWQKARTANPAEWEKIPEPEKPFFGRKIVE